MSYCEMLKRQLKDGAKGIVGDPEVHISHVYKCYFLATLDALEAHFKDNLDVFIWFDLFSMNQHTSMALSPEWVRVFLRDAIESFGHTVMVVSPWNNPIAYTRAWCVLEAYYTHVTGSKFEIAMSQAEHDDFIEKAIEDPQKVFHAMLGDISAKKSTSFIKEDQDIIHSMINEDVGFSNLDRLVKEQSGAWMISTSHRELDGTSDEERRAKLLNLLGELYRLQGRYKEALPLYEQALELNLTALGPDHEQTILSMGNLSYFRMNQGYYEEAKKLMEEAVKKSKSIMGQDHKRTLFYMRNLGMLHRNLGNYDEAKTLYEDVLDKMKVSSGVDHPDTLQVMSGLGMLYRDLGNYDEAKALLEDVLDKMKGSLGEDHPDTLQVMNGLGTLHRNLGNYDEAKALLEDVLDKMKGSLGEDHPDTLQVMNGLGMLQCDLESYDEAKTLLEDVLDKMRTVLGPDHPSTLQVINSLAAFHYEQGNHIEAFSLLQECAKKQQTSLGSNHPNTKTALELLSKVQNNLAIHKDLAQFISILHSDEPVSLENVKSFIASMGVEALFESLPYGATQTNPLGILCRSKPEPSFQVINYLFSYISVDKSLKEKFPESYERLKSHRERIYRKVVLDTATKGGVCPALRGRIIFVGQGRAGKSSTVGSLCGEEYDGARQSTAGAEVTDVKVLKELGADISEVGVGTGNDEACWKKQRRTDGSGKVRALCGHLAAGGKIERSKEQVEKEKKAADKFFAKYSGSDYPKNPVAVAGGRAASIEASKWFENDQEYVAQEVSHRRSNYRKNLLPQATKLKEKYSSEEIEGEGHDDALEDWVENEFRFSLWDFGGQGVFRQMQYLYLHQNGCYVVVINLQKFLSKDKREKDEAIENLVFWVKSIILYSASDDPSSRNNQQQHSPILLVGTHCGSIKDDIKDSSAEDKLKGIDQIIRRELGCDNTPPSRNTTTEQNDNSSTKNTVENKLKDIYIEGGKMCYNQKQDLCFWPVENSDHKDENIIYLRGLLRDLIMAQDYVQEAVPIPWLGAIDELVRVSEKHSLVPIKTLYNDSGAASIVGTLQECDVLSQEDSTDNNEATAVAFLKFCHGLGLFVYFDDIPGLQDYCILNPQWIIDQSTYIVRDFKLHRFQRDYDAMALQGGESWRIMLKKGILDVPLLQELWRGEDIDRIEFLVTFMIKVAFFSQLPRKFGSQTVGRGSNSLLSRNASEPNNPGSRLLVPSLITSPYHFSRNESPLLSKLDEYLCSYSCRSRSLVCGVLDENGSIHLTPSVADEYTAHRGRCTKSFEFPFFLPFGFYDRLVTTLVNRFLSRDAFPQDCVDYQDPVLFRDGCILYFMGSKSKPFAVHLNSASSRIDIITNAKDNLLDCIISEVNAAIDSINVNFCHGRLKVEPPQVSEASSLDAMISAEHTINFEVLSSESKSDTSYRNNVPIRERKDEFVTEFKDRIMNRKIEAFSTPLHKLGGLDLDKATAIARTIIQNRPGTDFFELKRNFDSDKKNGKNFEELTLQEYHNIGDPIDRSLIVKALMETPEPPPKEDYLFGCFVPAEDLPYVNKEKESIRTCVEGTHAQLSATNVEMETMKGFFRCDYDKSFKVLHFAMHNDILTKNLKPKKIKSLSERCEIIHHAKCASRLEGSAKCVFFNICSSNDLASRLCNEYGVPYAISWSTRVADDAAMAFAEGFYLFLSKNRDQYENFDEAFERAKKYLKDRDWVLVDPDDEKACEEEVDTTDGEQAAGIPRLYIAPGLKESRDDQQLEQNTYKPWEEGLLVKK